jgi:hypothetical protein
MDGDFGAVAGAVVHWKGEHSLKSVQVRARVQGFCLNFVEFRRVRGGLYCGYGCGVTDSYVSPYA